MTLEYALILAATSATALISLIAVVVRGPAPTVSQPAEESPPPPAEEPYSFELSAWAETPGGGLTEHFLQFTDNRGGVHVFRGSVHMKHYPSGTSVAHFDGYSVACRRVLQQIEWGDLDHLKTDKDTILSSVHPAA